MENKKCIFEKHATSLDWDKFLNTCFNEETFSLYEVYKAISAHFTMDVLDIEFFEQLKDIIKQLVRVNPLDRMELIVAKTKIMELAATATAKKNQFEKLLKLDQIIQTQNIENEISIPTIRTEKPTQISYGLMHALKSEVLMTISSTGSYRKLTQRNTRLCASFSAVLLLYDALNHFFEESNIDEKIEIDQWEVDNKTPSFIAQAVTIVCFVISPRSLNGLNNCHRDDKYQIVAQEQNIGEYLCNTIKQKTSLT